MKSNHFYILYLPLGLCLLGSIHPACVGSKRTEGQLAATGGGVYLTGTLHYVVAVNWWSNQTSRCSRMSRSLWTSSATPVVQLKYKQQFKNLSFKLYLGGRIYKSLDPEFSLLDILWLANQISCLVLITNSRSWKLLFCIWCLWLTCK